MPSTDLRILVVEDHAVQRRIVTMQLRNWGAKLVREAASGAEALRILRDPSTFVDLILLDLSMPDTDGFELMRQMRSLAPMPRVIVLSSLSAPLLAQVVQSMGAGDDRLLGAISKPLTRDKLGDLLEKIPVPCVAPGQPQVLAGQQQASHAR
ncbi:MAG: response regulator [Pseudomonadota bacterium]